MYWEMLEEWQDQKKTYGFTVGAYIACSEILQQIGTPDDWIAVADAKARSGANKFLNVQEQARACAKILAEYDGDFEVFYRRELKGLAEPWTRWNQ